MSEEVDVRDLYVCVSGSLEEQGEGGKGEGGGAKTNRKEPSGRDVVYACAWGWGCWARWASLGS